LQSNTTATTVAFAKIIGERGEWKKSVFASFFGCSEDRKFMEKTCFGASYSMSNKLLLVARHILTTGLQNVFKTGSVKFANSLSSPSSSTLKKVCTGSKSSQGT